MKPRVRILHMIGNGATGGREKQLYLVTRSQSALADYEVSVLFQNPEGPNYDRIAALPNVRVLSLPTQEEFSLRSMRATSAAAREANIVVLHSPRISFMLPLLFSRTPMVYRLSGMFMAPMNLMRKFRKGGQQPSGGAGSGDSGGDAPSTQTGTNGQAKRKRGMLHKFNVRAQRLSRWYLFSRAITQRASAVVVNSHFLQREAERVYHVPVDKFRLIRTGLDPAFEQARLDSAQPVEMPDNSFTVSVVARLDSRKRIDRLFEAVQPLIDGGESIRVVIAGDGPEKGKLERLAAKLGIEKNVRLLGTVANPYEVFCASDLFVLPSDNEAFPNAMLEAMFAGVAVVVFAGGNGAGEVIESGVDGFVVRDVDELRMLIRELSHDPERARRVAACAKARLAEKGLTLDRHIQSLDRLITSVLEGAN